MVWKPNVANFEYDDIPVTSFHLNATAIVVPAIGFTLFQKVVYNYKRKTSWQS
jgi:hypothetical protein